MNSFLAVAIGGAVGATLRFAISEVIQTPWGTFTVNIIGSLLLGICMAGLGNELISKDLAILLGTGLLGAFTTMSTFSLETVELWSDNPIHAIGYVGLTMVICPLLALAGWKAVELTA